jgi:anaerobic selenocysteine-containing dehydrogenase
MAVPDWEIFAGLARAMGHDLGFASLDDVRAEMEALGAAGERPRHRTPDAGGPALLGEAGEGDLVLFTYPLLVDEGRQLWGASQLKDALEEPAFAEVHPGDAAGRGLSDGAAVRVRTQAGEATLPVRVTDAVAAGSVFVPWNQPGCAANTLLSGRTTTAVTLEAAEPAGVAAGSEGATT